MGRNDRRLPAEFRGKLSYGEVTTTLESLSGEVVSIHVSLDASIHATVEMLGLLRVARKGETGVSVQIGGVAELALEESEFRAATMATFDGNYYFRLDIELSGALVAIADDELQGLASRI